MAALLSERMVPFHYSITERSVLLARVRIMSDRAATPLSGRRAQAAENDSRILLAARAVFIDDPGAPISAVATRAGVGISALYRRYASKEGLLRQLCGDGLRRYIAAAEAALADDGDPWIAFARFMGRVVDEDTHSLTLRLAGTFTPTEDLYRDAERAQDLNVQLFDRTMETGVIRPDLTVNDLTFLFEQLASVRSADEARTRKLRSRYLALHLDALRKGSAERLPGPAPSWEEVRDRWTSEGAGDA
jgi:AcrR family transcriptional regulator